MCVAKRSSVASLNDNTSYAHKCNTIDLSTQTDMYIFMHMYVRNAQIHSYTYKCGISVSVPSGYSRLQQNRFTYTDHVSAALGMIRS